MTFESNQTVYLKDISGNRPTNGRIEETTVVSIGDEAITTVNGLKFETIMGTQMEKNPLDIKWRMYETKEAAEQAIKRDQLSVFGRAFFHSSTFKHMTPEEINLMLALIETANKRAIEKNEV